MLLSVLLWLIAPVLLGLSISAGQWYRLWLGELIGAGYLWYAALTTVLGGSLLLFKLRPAQRRVIVVLAVALGFYASTLLNWYIPRMRDYRTGGIPLTVMTYNINYRLWETEKVTELVRSHPVDVFGLVEPFEDQAAELLKNVQDLYPHYYRATGGGLSLFSRYPITKATTDNLGTPYHNLFAVINLPGKSVQMVVAHPLAPITRQNFIRRNETIAALANYAAQQELTTIVMGDFNVTSWSIYFRNFILRSKLRSVNLGHGLNPTWFYHDSVRSLSRFEQLVQVLKIPIDHIFVSQNVSVEDAVTLPPGVSDHRPLLAKLRLM